MPNTTEDNNLNVWGSWVICAFAWTSKCPVGPITISLHVVLSAASLPSYLHPDRSLPFTQGSIILLIYFFCPALWWAALGSPSMLQDVFEPPWRRRWRRSVTKQMPRAPCTRRCVPQIMFMHLQVKWQSCLWGDVSSPLLESVWTCWVCACVKPNRWVRNVFRCKYFFYFKPALYLTRCLSLSVPREGLHMFFRAHIVLYMCVCVCICELTPDLCVCVSVEGVLTLLPVKGDLRPVQSLSGPRPTGLWGVRVYQLC